MGKNSVEKMVTQTTSIQFILPIMRIQAISDHFTSIFNGSLDVLHIFLEKYINI
jgi:hypothetical protein